MKTKARAKVRRPATIARARAGAPKSKAAKSASNNAAAARIAASDRRAAEPGGHDSGPRGGVQSLGRAFAILEEIARTREGVSLAQLSRRVGLHNSTTFHLVRTLVGLGYVRQLDDKRYRVGRPLFALAASALDDIEMVSLATPILEELSRATGEASHFAVRMGDSVVVIARTGGTGAFQLTDRVGVVRPAHCTALGKVILAGLTEGQVEQYLTRADLKPFTERSITTVAELRPALAEVRRAGFALDDGEFNAEVRCVALPVRDFTGRVIGALGISGPVWRLTMAALRERAPQVADAAKRLSAELGAPNIA